MFIKLRGIEDNKMLYVDPEDIIYLQSQGKGEDETITIAVLGTLKKFQIKWSLHLLIDSINGYYDQRLGVRNPFVTFNHTTVVNCRHIVGVTHDEKENVVTIITDGGVELDVSLFASSGKDLIYKIDDIKSTMYLASSTGTSDGGHS